MIRVVTGSRLHFGLLHVPADGVDRWPDGTQLRRYGGVGLMIERPAVAVRVEPAADWSATGPGAERALMYAKRFVEQASADPECRYRVTVEAYPPEHTGLGAGTQLGMAVGKAVACEQDMVISAAELARAVGRGERSAVGAHGFEAGGLIVDGGKATPNSLGFRVVRYYFPSAWRIVLARPHVGSEWHGTRERAAFLRPRPVEQSMRVTERMCRLVMLNLLPALGEYRPNAFGDALTEYNRLAGEAFADEQGGLYCGPAVTELVDQLRRWGVVGVGQSSWGPTVFGFTADQAEAENVVTRLRHHFPNLADVTISTARNTPALFESVNCSSPDHDPDQPDE